MKTPSQQSFVEVLLQAAELSGVEFRISRGRIRVKGPAGTAQLCLELFAHEADFVAVLSPEARPGDHDKPYDPSVQYLTATELERCDQVRDRVNRGRHAPAP